MAKTRYPELWVTAYRLSDDTQIVFSSEEEKKAFGAKINKMALESAGAKLVEETKVGEGVV